MSAPDDAADTSRLQDSSDGVLLPTIRRARHQRLTIYEVEESELAILERRALDTVYLNIAVALLSMSVSLTAALLTAEFPSDRAWLVLLVVTVVGYVAGVIMLLVW